MPVVSELQRALYRRPPLSSIDQPGQTLPSTEAAALFPSVDVMTSIEHEIASIAMKAIRKRKKVFVNTRLIYCAEPLWYAASAALSCALSGFFFSPSVSMSLAADVFVL
jgi:hypothetical protein